MVTGEAIGGRRDVGSIVEGQGRRRPDGRVVGIAAALLAVGALLLDSAYGWRQAALLLVGGALGLTLYHAAFGFTAAWRALITERRGAGVRAQMAMLAVAVVLFFPALAAGELFGRPVYGFVAPAGISVLVGAFIFGIGMQLGNGCASGTLYTVGGGSSRMLVTLAFFIVGSVVATHHLDWWLAQPSFAPLSLVRSWGLWPALSSNLAVFALVAGLTWWIERGTHARTAPNSPPDDIPRWRRLTQGPWPLIWGAVALAVLNFTTLALAGRPWGVTSAFALWGAKLGDAAGLGIADWPHWAARAGALERSIFADVTSVMNFGIVLGALLAAGLAGRFAPVWRLPWRSLAAAAIGGLLLGYGARLAFGCNIGAFFSGVASGSLHGWLWLIAAFAGNVIGVRLRPAFGFSSHSAHSDQKPTLMAGR